MKRFLLACLFSASALCASAANGATLYIPDMIHSRVLALDPATGAVRDAA